MRVQKIPKYVAIMLKLVYNLNMPCGINGIEQSFK